MHPGIKVTIGALMVITGVYSSITYSTELLNLLIGGIGPFLILLGGFIVWLESDELKMRRKENKKNTNKNTAKPENLRDGKNTNRENKNQGFNKDSDKSINRDYTQLLEGTVSEAKEEISELENPNYRALIAAERRDQGRKTLIEWLERRK